MSDTSSPSDPIGDVLGFLGGPILSTLGSNKQVKNGIDEMARLFKNLNGAVEALNETSGRLNAFMADVEEPIRKMVPVISRTFDAADKMVSTVSEPAMKAAPALLRTAQAFDTPTFSSLPSQVENLVEIFNELAKRLAPLTTVAGSAGGLLGRLQSFAGQGAAGVSGAAESASKRSAPTTSAATKSAATKSAATKSAAKKSAATKSAAKKSAATKSAATKSAAKKSAVKKSAATKSAR